MEQTSNRFPLSLNYALSLYANKGMFEAYEDTLKTLMAYSCVINMEAPFDKDLEDLFLTINPKKLVEGIEETFY
jgi:hypothetical protein